MDLTLPQMAARSPVSERTGKRPDTQRERMRLLLITDTDLAQRGGSERFLAHLLTGLNPAHFEIDLVQLDLAPSPLSEPWLREHSLSNLRIEHLPVGAIYGPAAWKVWRTLRARVRRGDYDIIQSQHEKSDLLNALLPGRGRVLKVSNRRDTGFKKRTGLRTLFRLLNHRFDLFVAPSRGILEQLARNEGVDATRTHCLPNGVDLRRFRPVGRGLRGLERRKLDLPEHAWLIGCVARMVPVKRHEDLIQGFAQIARAHPDACLVLVGGGGPLEAQLRRQVDDFGVSRQVIFCGEVRNTERLLPLMDAFALASSTEGMSNAILEAMACGLPVVATSVGGNLELVEDGVTGYLVPPFCPGELASALGRLLEKREQARQMGRAARQRAAESFSLDVMIAAYARLYETTAVREKQ
jgi:L-malate glycosyltransferase